MALSRRSRITRNVLVCIGGYLLVVTGAHVLRAGDEPATPSNIPLHVADSRTCAAASVYALSIADDWSQRAAIAQATLNRFDTLGHVPNCGAALTIIVRGLDTYEWQAALDAVDAVQSGSYALPLACARADTVLPLPAAPTEPPLLRAAAARAQCVIGDLAFVEAQR